LFTGSNTTLPALRNFCFYAAFGILFIFAFMVTWFVAFLVLDERRRTRSQGDIICCFVTKKEACCACCAPRADKRGRMEKAFGDGLGGALSKPMVKGFVCVFFAAIAVGGFIGCSQLEIDADVNDFIPAGSYVKDWFTDTNEYFAKLGDSIAVYSRDVDVHTADGAALMLAASTAFKADPYVAEASVSSWIESFNTHRGATGAFTLTDLYSWTTTAGSSGQPFKGDIVWKNETNDVPNEGIVSTRMRGNHVKSYKSDDKVKSMDSLRSSLDAVPGNGAGNVFAFSDSWLSYEQYKSIAEEATRNIASTMAGMVVIIAILLISPKAVLIVCLCLCLIIINIMGYMHFWGQTLDSVTIIMLIIALGLSVDYSAHIGRAFMEHTGTPNERLRNSLGDMGVAVFNGAISTFLAVIVLSGSESYVFITFFRQLFLCIVFGLGHGLILLPVLMSMFPPKPFANNNAHLQ
jgi:predicted RND superfamily exporter protein